jgi:tRNA U34 2-thiouridine synthase MnmA/TrmU
MIKGKEAVYTFDKKISSTSAGQACVFYLNNQVLGGGWITK